MPPQKLIKLPGRQSVIQPIPKHKKIIMQRTVFNFAHSKRFNSQRATNSRLKVMSIVNAIYVWLKEKYYER